MKMPYAKAEASKKLEVTAPPVVPLLALLAPLIFGAVLTVTSTR